MIWSNLTSFGNALLRRAGPADDSVARRAARDVRERVIEPVGEGLRAGADAAASRVKRLNGDSRLNAPVLVLAGVAGALGEFFLDPQSGRRRRAVAKDRVAAFFRRRAADAGRQSRYAAGAAKGAAHQVTPSGREPAELNDPALAAKVESEIFRDRDAPKGEVSVDVTYGVVHLRGELESSEQIKELVDAAGEVEGVRGVENLLHLPGEEAPSRSDGHSAHHARAQAPLRSK